MSQCSTTTASCSPTCENNMYAKYVANSSWTLAQVMADFTALMTGTLLANLSASCNIAASEQTNTIAAGWTLHDDATGQQTGYVIKVADKDAITTKYINMYSASTTSLYFRALEDWDVSLNTTTNASTATAAMTLGAVGAAFTILVFCTPEYILLVNTSSGTNHIGHYEILRDTPFLYNATVKPLVHCVFQNTYFHSASSQFYLPRLMNPKTGATLVTTDAALVPTTYNLHWVTSITGVNQTVQQTPLLDSSGNQFHMTQPICMAWVDTARHQTVHLGRVAANVNGRAPLFTRCDITGAALGDLMTIDGTDYVYASQSYGLLYPKE